MISTEQKQKIIEVFLFDFRELYIADERFFPFFKDPYNQWALQLKFVTERDNGVYECAVVSICKIVALKSF